MKVAVIGAGVVGVTTAYELAVDGHEVTVFERRGSVAAEGSFANAGIMSAALVSPWAAPSRLAVLARRSASIHVPLNPNIATARWLWHWWRACRTRTHEANRLRMQRLVHFSQERLHRITHDLALDYERSEGCLVLLRTPRALAQIQPGLEALSTSKTPFETLDAAQCRAVEPGLNDDTALHAGIYLRSGELGNCRQFAHLLRGEAQKLGVRFRFHTPVRRIVPGAKPELVHMHMPPQDSTVLIHSPSDAAGSEARDTEPMPLQPITERFDSVFVCASLDSAALLRPHGLKLPLQAVHGYSVTAPLRRHDGHPDQAPHSALIDERHQVTIGRLGSRLRVAGGTELGGSPTRHQAASLETLYKVLHDWFPGSARLSQAQVWKGSRAVLPDGPPVLGRSGIEGVWLNLGHGANGWAMACGSARLLADSFAGRPAPIDIEGLGIERLRS